MHSEVGKYFRSTGKVHAELLRHLMVQAFAYDFTLLRHPEMTFLSEQLATRLLCQCIQGACQYHLHAIRSAECSDCAALMEMLPLLAYLNCTWQDTQRQLMSGLSLQRHSANALACCMQLPTEKSS